MYGVTNPMYSDVKVGLTFTMRTADGAAVDVQAAAVDLHVQPNQFLNASFFLDDHRVLARGLLPDPHTVH